MADRSPLSPPARHYTTFAVLWVIAGWFHLLNQVPYPRLPLWRPTLAQALLEAAILAVGLGVLYRPRRTDLFALFLSLELVHVLRDAPWVANHWLLTGLAAGAMLISAVSVRRREGYLPAGAWFERFAPAVRLLILVGYAFAAWAKLNTHFLSREVSCASTTWVAIGAESFWWLPQGAFFEYGAIVTTVLAELAIPVLLLWPGRRHWGVWVGLGFHYLISIPPQLHVPDFASLLFAWWWLWLPHDVGARLHARLASVARLFPVITRGRLVALLSVLGFWPILWYLAGPDATVPFRPDRMLADFLSFNRITAFTLYGLGWIVLMLLSMRGEDGTVGEEPVTPVRLRHGGHVALVAIALLTGLSPYLGQRTVANFSMFSNLRTEGGADNHLVMPTIHLTDHQLDLAEILDSSDRKLAEAAERGPMLPWWQVRYWARRNPEAFLAYRHEGETFEGRIADQPALLEPVAWWEEWMYAFRPVRLDAPSRCAW